MKNNKLTFLAFITVSVLLGVNFIFIKLTNRELPPFAGAAIRFLLASTILFLVARIKKLTIPKGRELKLSALYGILAFGLNSGLLYWGLIGAPSEIASIIYSTVPLTTVLLSAFLKIEKLTKIQIISALSAICGISIIFSSQLSADVQLIRLLAVFAASLFAAFSTFLVKKCSNLHPVSLNSVAMFSGSVTLFDASIFAQEPIKLPTLSSTWVGLLWLVTSSCIAFVLMTHLIKSWSPSKASYTSVLVPIVTIAAGLLTAHSHINTNTLIGSSVVATGVGLHLFKKY